MALNGLSRGRHHAHSGHGSHPKVFLKLSTFVFLFASRFQASVSDHIPDFTKLSPRPSSTSSVPMTASHGKSSSMSPAFDGIHTTKRNRGTFRSNNEHRIDATESEFTVHLMAFKWQFRTPNCGEVSYSLYNFIQRVLLLEL